MCTKALFLTIVTITGAAFLCAQPLRAQQSAAAVHNQVHNYRTSHENEIVGEFARFLSIPNLASDTPNIERNAQAITTMLAMPRQNSVPPEF